MPIHPNFKWRKTELVFPDTVLRQDDWTLLDATGDRIALLFYTGADDLIGTWCWRVWLDYKMQKRASELK
ncbi:MAG: hypothetical protein ACKOEW_05910 [Methylocystis sp.]